MLIRYVLHQLLVHRGIPRLNLLLGSHLLALLFHTHILELIFVDKLGEELQDTLWAHRALFVDVSYSFSVLFLLYSCVGWGHRKLLLKVHDKLLVLKLNLLNRLQNVWVNSCICWRALALLDLWVAVHLLPVSIKLLLWRLVCVKMRIAYWLTDLNLLLLLLDDRIWGIGR